MFRDLCVLYAFMRRTDDLGDDEGAPVEIRRSRLQDWRGALHAALQGEEVDDLVLPAVAEMLPRRGIPAELLHEAISGVESDLAPRVLTTFADLERYCYLVAGTVGLCCIHLWGFHDPRAPEAARDCGTAFQLTNILRDLAEDAARGRCYLPEEDLERFGCTREQLARGEQNAAFRELMAFEARRTHEFYDRAAMLPDWLFPEGARSFRLMHRTYRGLLREIERRRFDVFTRRVRLGAWERGRLIASALLRW